jgi:hypothetical protein
MRTYRNIQNQTRVRAAASRKSENATPFITAQRPENPILQMQRTIGNRAVCRLALQTLPSGPAEKKLAPFSGVGPSALYVQSAPASRNLILLRRRRTPVLEYGRRKNRLERELQKIKDGPSSVQIRNKRKRFIRKILVQILHKNPFKLIDVKNITGGARAETEWRNPAKKNLGIKVTFDESIFKDPLALIIATVIHESAHADQLKAGMDYYVAPTRRVGAIEGIYRRAVNYFAEADARIHTLLTFVKALPRGHKKRILTEITVLLKKADKTIDRMDSAEYRRRGRIYQRRLTRLFAGKQLKHGANIKKIWKKDKSHIGLKNDLLPWRKLP